MCAGKSFPVCGPGSNHNTATWYGRDVRNAFLERKRLLKAQIEIADTSVLTDVIEHIATCVTQLYKGSVCR